MNRTAFRLPTACGQKGKSKPNRFVPLVGLLTLSLAACEFQTKSGNYKVTTSSQTRTLQVAPVVAQPKPKPNAKQLAGRAAFKKPLAKPSPSEKTVVEADPSPSPEVSPTFQPELVAQNEFDGGYDPWADPNFLGVAPTPSASPSEDQALLDRENDLKMGTVSGTETLAEDKTEDQLAKYDEYLRSLVDAYSGEPLYPAPTGDLSQEEYSDPAAQKAAEFVRDKILFEAFKPTYERMAMLADPDVNHAAETGGVDHRVFRGTAAVDKSQEFLQRKLDLAKFETTLKFVQELKDNNQRYVMSMDTAVQMSIEMTANAAFSLEAFADAYDIKITGGATPSIPTMNTCLTELGVSIDWGKVPAIGQSLLASQNLNP